MTTITTFPQRLKLFREKMGYTQEELAYKIGIAKHTVSNYEQGISEPTARIHQELAKSLDTNYEFLLSGEDEIRKDITAIIAELRKITDFDKIRIIKTEHLNYNNYNFLIDDQCIECVMKHWNSHGIFKRNKGIVTINSYCTKPYAQEVIIKYAQNRNKYKRLFNL